MDLIDKAVEKGTHKTGLEEIDYQTWNTFDDVRAGKKLVLFGIGACAEFFFYRYGLREPIDAVIDNHKTGKTLEECFEYTYGTVNSRLLVQEETVLKEYEPKNTVILVCSTNHCIDILNKLYTYGMKHVFVLHIMEINERAEKGICDVEPVTREQKNLFFEKEARKTPIEQKKIIFYAFGTYSDHGKYISEMLWKQKKDLDIVWILKQNYIQDDVPDYIRVISDSPRHKYIYEMSTAHIWVFNIEVPSFIEKREGQIYFQAKHWASVTLKKCYLDSKTLLNSPNLENWKRNSSMMDYIFTGSKFDSDFCRRAFGFKGETLEVGSARSDILFTPKEAAERIRKRYQIPQDSKILMYAPTFRYKDGDCSKSCEYVLPVDFLLIKNALEERFGGEWMILLRLHPNVQPHVGKLQLEPWVRNATDYSDSQELVAACDVLISDFSSIMFEPAFVHKPVFLLADDYDSYVDKEYELAINYESLPFSRAETNEQLVENIRGYEEQEYIERVDAFMKHYGVNEDGHAAERAAKYILGVIEG